ncbi:MAG: NAD(P)-dependent dehydrogenase (short-subunit alcohol dehydrogenase family) [Alphaproteobacteria bacterium]|jgi:NAD(P)-dependent dehydrogenase (short-subunit alcohol dehydrogenase family)
MDLGLTNKSVVVTGGNRGIGRGIALAFAREGANVAIVGRDTDALAKVKAEIEAIGVKAHAIAADLFTAEGCERAVNETADTFGGLDVLVNNASTSISGTLETLTDDQLMERLSGKTLAYMRCCRAALPWFRKPGGGRVICIGGSAARAAGKASLPSGLGNSSLTNFAKHFSNDVAPENITVNVVHPPFTKTDRYPARLEARAKELGGTLAETEASFAADFPIGRIVEPDDIAPLTLFLASPHAAAITGQAISVDGGATSGVFY